jgi:hypothetical protein
MNLNIYAIYDKIQKNFHTPMYQHNDGAMLRSIQQAVNDKESFLFKNPQDYAVYRVGTWDDNGVLEGMKDNIKVVEVVELVDHAKIDEGELDMLASELKEIRAVVDSLKTLIVGNIGYSKEEIL